MAITAKEFEEGRRLFSRELERRGRGAGPCFAGDGGYAIPWHDQYFERDIEPSGTVNCAQALRVGATQASLFVFVKASAGNDAVLRIPAGATITLALMQGDAERGEFEDVGPTICVKAPAAGMTVEPGMLACRFAIGDFGKPWLMVSLEFSGAITGGTVDCCLGYAAR